MTESTKRHSLLDELDAQQNEVLTQLDLLNQRVEHLLQECSAYHETKSPAEIA